MESNHENWFTVIHTTWTWLYVELWMNAYFQVVLITQNGSLCFTLPSSTRLTLLPEHSATKTKQISTLFIQQKTGQLCVTLSAWCTCMSSTLCPPVLLVLLHWHWAFLHSERCCFRASFLLVHCRVDALWHDSGNVHSNCWFNNMDKQTYSLHWLSFLPYPLFG